MTSTLTELRPGSETITEASYSTESTDTKGTKIALIGWSLEAIEAIDMLKRPFLVVGPSDFKSFAEKYEIPFVSWDFNKAPAYSGNNVNPKWGPEMKTESQIRPGIEEVNQSADELYNILKAQNVNLAIGLFEETVEWAGALNARFMRDPSIFSKALLFRNKAKMKRRAQMAGLQVGVYEEANNKEDIHRFLKRVREVSFKENEKIFPVHVKLLDKAGTVGHRVIYTDKDIDEKLNDSSFPCLVESHLDGKEFSVETFIHNGKIRFMNISDYVVFEHSIMVPPSTLLEKNRPLIRQAMERLVDAFEIKYGLTHAEFFLSAKGDIMFGEVASRVPGGHIFNLIHRAYGFNPFQGHIICCDPNTSEEELREFFPEETEARGHASCIMAYPDVNYITNLDIPEELEDEPYFEKHNMFIPAIREVQQIEGNGNHYGTVFLYGDDSEKMKQPIMKYVNHRFYI